MSKDEPQDVEAPDSTRPEPPQSSSSVTFGFPGCATTLICSIVGGIVGIAGLFATIGHGDDWPIILMIFGPIGGISGAIWGAFVGVVIGTKKRQ